MSKTLLLRVLYATILAGALCGGRFAVADVISYGSLDQILMASSPPMSLGPIASAGRTSWDCQPERAAGSPRWEDAGLSSSAGKP